MGSPSVAQIVSDNVKNRFTINYAFPNAAASLPNLSMFRADGNNHRS
jgi:hypothetical protein